MINFRKLIESDLPAFIQMRVQQLREEGARREIDLEPSLWDYYSRHLHDGSFVSWLAMDGDHIVGTSGLSIVEKPPYFSNHSGRIGLLSSMYTIPAYRRQGIARALLEHMIQEARIQGCGVIQITASDMGILLYTACGFEKNDHFMQLKL